MVKFQLGRGRTPSPPPLGYAYTPSEENKKGARKFSVMFLAFSNEISTVQKIVLSSSRGQGNFQGLEASRPRPRTSKCVLEDSTSAHHYSRFEVEVKMLKHPDSQMISHRLVSSVIHYRDIRSSSSENMRELNGKFLLF